MLLKTVYSFFKHSRLIYQSQVFLNKNSFASSNQPKASENQAKISNSLDQNDATALVLRGISNLLKGLKNVNKTVEFQPDLSKEDKTKRKQFLVFRYNPEDPKDEPKYMSYYIDLNTIQPMYLDALIKIKDNYDSSLAFRRSCREGICGSCAMNCNGELTLACTKEIDKDLKKPAIIAPLGHQFILKDLIVDLTNFYTQYSKIDPYLKRKTPKEEGQREYLQSKEDRKKLDGLYECILCACCSTGCPEYWWHADRYLGPAVLQQAYRWVIDSRDEFQKERLQKLAEDMQTEACQNIGMCTITCPKGLDPQKSLQILMKMIREVKKKKNDSNNL